MSDAFTSRVRELFLEACSREKDERAAFLDEACAGDDPAVRVEVESLLEHDDPADAFLDPASLNAPADAPGRPDRIGDHRITGRLGEGGVGIVYRAEQDNPQRTVALKVIRPTMLDGVTLLRFEQEAAILARLQHAGIAQVYDAGVDQSRGEPAPYYTMELVDGLPLLEHAERAGLSRRARLDLFLRVCDAVQHAHRHAVIHRDLKPSNIMVDASGQPKILDFGIARVTDARRRETILTRSGLIVGTLAYMAPEQLEGDARRADLRVDVYALGAILYELLTGRRPVDVADMPLLEAARRVRDAEPAPPSTWDRTLAGELETIVMHALEKAPDRRYASVADLASDIGRFLRREPITARPPTTAYVLRKFVSRNRGLVTAAGIVAAVVLAGGIVSTALYLETRSANDQLTTERNAANDARDEAQALVEFLVETLGTADPARSGRDARVADALDRASARAGEAYAEMPGVHAQVRTTLGQTYYGLALYEQAAFELEQAFELRRRIEGDDGEETLKAMNDLSLCYQQLGRLEDAEALLDESIRRGIRAHGYNESIPLRLNNLATLRRAMGNLAGAAEAYRQALAADPGSPGDDAESDATLAIRHNLASLLVQLGRPEEAEPIAGEVLDRCLDRFGPTHPYTLMCRHNIATIQRERGRLGEAEHTARALLETKREVFGADHPSTLVTEALIADILRVDQRYEEARATIADVLPRTRDARGAHRETVSVQRILADVLLALGRTTEAEEVAAEALAMAEEVLPAHHWLIGDVRSLAGRCALARGDALRALELAEQASAELEQTLPDTHRRVRAARATAARAAALLAGAEAGTTDPDAD